jgi:hypothetical protein
MLVCPALLPPAMRCRRMIPHIKVFIPGFEHLRSRFALNALARLPIDSGRYQLGSIFEPP